MGVTEILFIIINFYTCGRAHQTQTRLKALVYDKVPESDARSVHQTVIIIPLYLWPPPRMSSPH